MEVKNRKIGLFSSVAFAVGAMIGGGVFVLSGVALQKTGPSAILSFLLAGVMVLLSALSFAVIASRSNSEYSGYGLVGRLLGSSVWSFLTSWCFYLAGIIGAAFVLNAFGVYLHEFIAHYQSAVFWAIIAAAGLTLLNFGPASKIGKIESLLVSVKLLILVLLIAFGLAHFSGSDFQPFYPKGGVEVLVTSAFLFIAFLGFNVISNISSDVINPKKTIPRAIVISMLIVTVVYMGVVVALLAAHINNYSEASVGVAAKKLIGPVGGGLVIIGALISTLSSANANILGSSEIMVRMALDKQVPTIFAKLRHGHPYYSVLASAILYVVLILTKQTQAIISLANVTAIVALVIVNLAAIKALETPKNECLKLPFGRLLPMLGIIGALAQFIFMPLVIVIIGISLVAVGLIAYSLRRVLHDPKLHQELIKVFRRSEGPLVRALKRG